MLPELWECTSREFLYLKAAIFQSELRECAPRTTFVLKSCDFPAGAASTLRILRLHLKAEMFQPELHAPRTTFVLKSCDFQAGAAVDRGESNPRPRDCGSRRANHETTSKGHFASNKIARRHSESTSTRTISAEGSPRLRRIRTAPQRERFDTHDPRRGSRGHIKKKRKKPQVVAPRPRRSPQRVARAPQKKKKNLEFLHLDHTDPRRGSRAFKKHKKVFTPRSRRSPQRVARAYQKKQKTSSFCTSTRPIPAEGRIPDRRQHPHPQP